MGVRAQLEPAYVLSSRAYRDSSLLLEILSLRHGRCGLVARSARGPKSKTRALLQPLQPLLLSWSLTGELGTLSAAEAAGAPILLSGERVFYAWYLNELLLKLLQRHDPHPMLFERYAHALAQLPQPDAEAALRFFEKNLLSELGYGLLLPQDLQADEHYKYDAERGPIAGGRHAELLGASLIALRDETPLDARALSDTRKLLRAQIERQLGGRALETPRLLRELRALEKL